MNRPLLALGARGPHVTEMKGLLKKKCLEIDPYWDVDAIKDDDKFDAETKRCLTDYQTKAMLVADGKCGNNTWAALLNAETFNAYAEPPVFLNAPDDYTCWAAAVAMLKGEHTANTWRPSGVQFEPRANGALGGLDNSSANMRLFAKQHNLQMVEEPYFGAADLCWLVTVFGRLMLNVRGVTPRLTIGRPTDSHLVVLVGLRGDGSSGGTTLRILNPALQGNTKRSVVASFKYLKTKYPGLTYQTFYRITGNAQEIP